MKKKPRRPKPRVPVLVVCNGNGFIELYAGREVDALVVNRLDVAVVQAAEISRAPTAAKIPRTFLSGDATSDRPMREGDAGNGNLETAKAGRVERTSPIPR